MKINSIIIPTYNAEAYLPMLLEKIKQESSRNFELIIIDSSSKDNTVYIANNYTDNIIIVPQSEFDHGGTRAQAAKIAKGEILIYFTQDALPADQFSIEKIIKAFDDPKVAAAYGRQLSYPETNLFGKHLRAFNYPSETIYRTKQDISQYGIKTAQLSNSFAAYRKSVLMEVGNFKNGLILGEDVYIGAKMILADYTLAYVADAEVYHSHSYTVWQEFKRYFDIGVFHQSEHWIINEFGKADGEGIRYIRSEYNYLLSQGAWCKIPEFFVRNAMKYFGYKMGQNYQLVPMWMIQRISMHHRWWKL